MSIRTTPAAISLELRSPSTHRAVLIGAPGDNTGAAHSGQAYQYDLNGAMLYTLNNPTPAANDNFGAPVSLFGTGTSIIGAPNDDTAATDAGRFMPSAQPECERGQD